MIIPIFIKAKNLLSFESFIYYFKKGETTCIMGENLTDSGQKSNGSGKSALQTAVELSFKGDFSRKVSKTKLVRKGFKELEVESCSFNNVKNEYLYIQRIIPVKGSEKVSVYIYKDINEFNNDKDKFKIDIATTLDSNNWIIDYIGISKEDLSNYFFPNELTYKSFFDSSDTSKKELIGRFSNADVADKAFINISEELDELDSKIVEFEKGLLKLETTLENRQTDLEFETNRDLKVEQQEQIQEIKGEISIIKNNINESLANIKSFREQVKYFTKIKLRFVKALERKQLKIETYLKGQKDWDQLTSKFDTEKNLIQKNLKESDNLIGEIELDLKSINKDIKDTELGLVGVITCPKCEHEFLLSGDFTVEELNKKLEEFKKEKEEADKDLKEADKLYAKYSKKQSELNQKISVITSEEFEFNKGLNKLKKQLIILEDYLSDEVEPEISSFNRSINEEQGLIQNYNKSIELKETLINEIEEKDISKNPKVKELKGIIKSVKKDIKDKEQKISELQGEYESVKSWELYYKSFKSYLSNKKLKIIEGMMNKFLLDMEVDYQIKLEGYKQLNSGEIREKITPYVFKDGQLWEFGEFSKGERTRMNMVNLLTLQTLINETSKTGGMDIAFPDEIFEGLDEEGLGLLLKALNKTSKTTLLTTHVNNDKIYENILMIKKINGISVIV